jgi:hypothetical protein
MAHIITAGTFSGGVLRNFCAHLLRGRRKLSTGKTPTYMATANTAKIWDMMFMREG